MNTGEVGATWERGPANCPICEVAIRPHQGPRTQTCGDLECQRYWKWRQDGRRRGQTTVPAVCVRCAGPKHCPGGGRLCVDCCEVADLVLRRWISSEAFERTPLQEIVFDLQITYGAAEKRLSRIRQTLSDPNGVTQ